MKNMEIDYSKQHWDKGACPKVDCRKNSCKCGLKKVFLASALGDDSKDSPIAPKNGDYCNAIVVYEANGHIYIYSSEGIPTMMTADVAGLEDLEEAIRNAQSDIVELDGDLLEETRNRESGDGALQEEIDAIKNSPDVVDIVATYAALQAYDTSKLGDNDIVRVLADEQHDGASTYYRWNKQSSTWTYIGEVGDYYTKGQVDTLLADKQDELTAGENISIVEDGGSLVISALGNVRVLTTDDYNYPENNPSGVGIWKLETGVYRTEGSVNVYPHTGTLIIPSKYELLFVSGKSAYVYTMRYNGAKTMAMFSADRTTGVGQDEGSIFSNSLVVDNLTSTSTSNPLSANQGKTLKDLIDGLIISGAGAPTTSTVGTIGQLYEDTTNGKLYQCTSTSGGTYTWSEVGGGGITPVQTTGASTTDVMSQKAVTDELYPQYSAHTKGVIGIGDYSAIADYGDTKIGIGKVNLGASSAYALSINGGDSTGTVNAISAMGIWAGAGGSVTGHSGVAIGNGASVSGAGGVAIGANSSSTQQGEFNIGTSNTSRGYNSTNYRLITGVHDPVSAHDAATKGYVDSHSGGVKKLTSADYNDHYSGSTDDVIALWLLDEGEYLIEGNTAYYTSTSGIATSPQNVGVIIFVKPTGTGSNERGGFLIQEQTQTQLFTRIDSTGSNGNGVVVPRQLANDLTTSASGYALDARQGKALNDRIIKTPYYIAASDLPAVGGTVSGKSLFMDRNMASGDKTNGQSFLNMVNNDNNDHNWKLKIVDYYGTAKDLELFITGVTKSLNAVSPSPTDNVKAMFTYSDGTATRTLTIWAEGTGKDDFYYSLV